MFQFNGFLAQSKVLPNFLPVCPSLAGKSPNTLKGYEVNFLDSVTSTGMEPEELEEIKEQYPNILFIYILQTNKQGSFYGKKK